MFLKIKKTYRKLIFTFKINSNYLALSKICNKNMKLLLFKPLRNCKRRGKENFTLKSNSNNITLCVGEG